MDRGSGARSRTRVQASLIGIVSIRRLKNADRACRIVDFVIRIRVSFRKIERIDSANRSIIPVLVDGARMPKESELPDSLKLLHRRQAVEVRHRYFGRDAEALIGRMLAVLGNEVRSRKTVGALLGLTRYALGSAPRFLLRANERQLGCGNSGRNDVAQLEKISCGPLSGGLGRKYARFVACPNGYFSRNRVA